MNKENIWGNIRQFRKNLKPTRSSLSQNTSSGPTHQRSSSQILASSLCPNPHFNESNKENVWNLINRNQNSIPKRYPKDSKEEDTTLMPLNSFRGATSFRIPMTRENQIGDRSSKGSQSFITHRPERKTIESLFAGKQNSMVKDDDSSEDTDSTENNQDQQLVQEVLEQKRKMEEDLKGTKQLVLKIRKENNQYLKNTQVQLEKQQQELHQYYQKIIADMKSKHEKDLKEKEEEIEALNSFISTHDDSHIAAREKHKTIEEYEEVIQGMKKDFEEEITRMAGYYQRKSQQSLEEKKKLQREIMDLKAHIQQLQQMPTTRREHGADSSRVEMETTNRMHHTHANGHGHGNIPKLSIPIHRKPHHNHDTGIQSLLEKINKYMDENIIENEVSISNRRELYKEIYNSSQHEKTKPLGIKPLKILGEMPTKMSGRIGSMSLARKENVEEGDSDYFQSIIEECEQNNATSDLITDEEDTPMMNYSIKNLNNQLRFKPKCEFES